MLGEYYCAESVSPQDNTALSQSSQYHTAGSQASSLIFCTGLQRDSVDCYSTKKGLNAVFFTTNSKTKFSFDFPLHDTAESQFFRY